MDRFYFIKNDIKDLTKKLRFYKGGLVGLLLLFFFFFFTSELWFDGNHGEKMLGSSLKVS